MIDKLKDRQPGVSRSLGIVLITLFICGLHIILGLASMIAATFGVAAPPEGSTYHFLDKAVFLAMATLSGGYAGIALTLAKAGRYGTDRMDPFILWFVMMAVVVVLYTIGLLGDTLSIFTDMAAEGIVMGILSVLVAVLIAVVNGRHKEPE